MQALPGSHAYTGLGLVLAAVMGVCIVHGTLSSFRLAFGCMLVACLVDATDGTLARRLQVKEMLPNFDGAKLDDLIDFLTFTFLPLAPIWRAELLPPQASWLLIVALVASGYGFCQVPAKTTDGYFVGFPSYWNIVAFYLYVLAFPTWIAAAIVLVLSVMTFVPSYYLYPSRVPAFSRLSNFLGGIWVAALVWLFGDLAGQRQRSGRERRARRSGSGARVAVLPCLLHGNFVVDHHQAVAQSVRATWWLKSEIAVGRPS